MRMQPQFIAALAVLLSACCLCMMYGKEPAAKVVAVREGQLEVFDAGQRTLTSSKTGKTSPVWSLDGATIAFLETKSADRLPELALIDGSGHVLAQHQLFPNSVPGDQKSGVVPRSLAILGYVDDSSLLMEGNVNRWVCSYLFVEPKTGAVEREALGECGPAQFSPDRRVFITEPNLRSGPPALWRDFISGGGSLQYPSDRKPVRFLSDPTFSDDGHWIGIVERDVEKGVVEMAILDPEWRPARTPLPSSFAASSANETEETVEPAVALVWRDSAFVLSDGLSTIRVSPGETILRTASPLTTQELQLASLAAKRQQAVGERRDALHALGFKENLLEIAYDLWPSRGPGFTR